MNTKYQTQAQSPLSGKQGGASGAQIRPLFGAQRLSTNRTSQWLQFSSCFSTFLHENADWAYLSITVGGPIMRIVLHINSDIRNRRITIYPDKWSRHSGLVQ